MKLSTRLLLPLVGAVTAVMAVFAFWAQTRRETTMLAEARRETEAYATALGLALEGAFRDPDLAQVQDLIDRLSQEPTIYAILVYDVDATARFASHTLPFLDPPPISLVQEVLEGDRPISLERIIGEQEVYSVLRAFRQPGGEVAGAFEVAQPLSAVRAEVARTRQRFLLNTLALLISVAGLTWWMVGRMVSRPLQRFSQAVQALGRGDLSYRVDAAVTSGELAEVAAHLNQMADHLQAARQDLVLETEERIALERRLQASERMAAVGNLAARVGHEIAAPLHVIRGRADLLLKADQGPEDRWRQLRIIVEQIDRITVIVRNLLSFARRPEPQLRPVELDGIISSVSEFLEAELRRAGVELSWTPGAPATVTGDPDLLYQVFTNLILNAIQAMESVTGERRLTVSMRREAERPGGRPAWVVVDLLDTGPGIEESVLPQIFEPFFTTKSGAAGTGLGLAVARSAVEQMGGSLVAANRREAVAGGEEAEPPRPGARFSVTLPSVGHGEEVKGA